MGGPVRAEGEGRAEEAVEWRVDARKDGENVKFYLEWYLDLTQNTLHISGNKSEYHSKSKI
jgi:hypothetical protein